jgi:hypothetical protein
MKSQQLSSQISHIDDGGDAASTARVHDRIAGTPGEQAPAPRGRGAGLNFA